MYDVMQGVRVIEVSEHTFAPAAGALLADWGADVIKVERTVGGGDAARTMRHTTRPGERRNAFFEVANRGKRSVAIDLRNEEGRALLYRLIEAADVFITNLRRDARQKMGIEPEILMARNPKLIYARATGYGNQGPMAQHGGFDYPSSWCRSGAGFAQTPANGDPPPMQPGSVGDLTGGATFAGAISAALFRRERTGKGALVDHALYGMGAYIMTQSITGASIARQDPNQAALPPRKANPLVRLYKTSDERWLCLCLLQDRWFTDLARRMGREDLLADERFATEDAKFANAAALVEQLSLTFASRTLAEWNDTLMGMEGVWAPLQSPAEVAEDVQALANGFVTEVTADDGFTFLSAAGPGQFDGRPVGELHASPAYAQHTDQVLAEAGLTPAQIVALREAQAIV
jgi:formyl-CoA transferase